MNRWYALAKLAAPETSCKRAGWSSQTDHVGTPVKRMRCEGLVADARDHATAFTCFPHSEQFHACHDAQPLLAPSASCGSTSTESSSSSACMGSNCQSVGDSTATPLMDRTTAPISCASSDACDRAAVPTFRSHMKRHLSCATYRVLADDDSMGRTESTDSNFMTVTTRPDVLGHESNTDQSECKVDLPVSVRVTWIETDPKRHTDIKTADGCRIVFYPQFLTVAGCDAIRQFFDSLSDAQWLSGISSFGHAVPRLVLWYAQQHIRFAGRNWKPTPYPPLLFELQSVIDRFAQQHLQASTMFGSCLVNKYRHGDDSISKHTEMNMNLDPGNTQQHYVHWIPKEPSVQGVRYNMTFRPHFDRARDST